MPVVVIVAELEGSLPALRLGAEAFGDVLIPGARIVAYTSGVDYDDAVEGFMEMEAGG